MSCSFDDYVYLCPSREKCSDSSCSWGASLKGLLMSSRLPKSQWKKVGLIPDDVDVDAYERLAEIRESIYDCVYPEQDYKNILICSKNAGNGKTTWAIKLLQQYFISIASYSYLDPEEGIMHGCFVPTTQFIHDAKQFGRPVYERYEKLADTADKAEFTVFDDVGAAEYTKYDYTTLLVAIDRRVFAKKCCVFTTNLTTKEDMVKKVGERLADRIWDTSEIIEFKGDGVRC